MEQKTYYKYLGVLNLWTEKPEEYKKCREAGHKTKEISWNQRGSNNDVFCNKCKIHWNYDCSD